MDIEVEGDEELAEHAEFMAQMIADEIEILRRIASEADCDFRYEIGLEIVALEGARQYFEHKAADFGLVPEGACIN